MRRAMTRHCYYYFDVGSSSFVPLGRRRLTRRAVWLAALAIVLFVIGVLIGWHTAAPADAPSAESLVIRQVKTCTGYWVRHAPPLSPACHDAVISLL